MRYLRLIICLMRYHFLRILEFRTEVVSWWIVNLMWPILALLSTNIIFGQVNSVAGWTKNEVLLVVCLQEIFIGVIWIFAIPSLIDFAKLIPKGDFDQLLLKPVNLRFLITFNKFEFDQYPRIFIMAYITSKILMGFGVVNMINIILGVVIFFIGVILFYNLYFIISTTTFWFTKLHNLEDFFADIMNFGRYPVYIFNNGLRFLLTYVIPAAFMSTFPAQAFLGRLNILYLILGIFVCVVSFIFSQWFWNFALKRYSSASS